MLTRQEQILRRRKSLQTWQGQWKMVACVYTVMSRRAGQFLGEGGNRDKSTQVTWSEANRVSVCINRKTILKISALTCTSSLHGQLSPAKMWSPHACSFQPPVLLYLQIWIAMRFQGLLVRPWLHDQAPIVLVSPLHGGPGADDAGRRPEGEIVQVLMHGVEKSLFICNTGSKPSASSYVTAFSFSLNHCTCCNTSLEAVACHWRETQCLLQPTAGLEAKRVSLRPIPRGTESTVVALGSAMARGHSECREAAGLCDPSEDSFWPSPPATPCQVFTIRLGCSPVS